MDTGITADQFAANVNGLSASFDAAGMLVNDEADEAQTEVLILIPDANVSMLIGKSGANVNALKEASGVNMSFTKQDESVRGMRKCFVSGPQKRVFKAIYLVVNLIGETQTGGVNFSLVVGHKAAGAIIGKGGENLKNIREQTGCNTSMEKQMEAVPSFGGRTLTLKHDDSAHAVGHAAYLAMRVTGFASVNQKEVRAAAASFTAPGAAASFGGYGPAGKAPKQRFSPYGGNPDTCAVHGKKRGKQNLTPSHSMPGSYQCFDHDQCKGGAVGAAAGYGMYDPMMGAAGMMGMGEQYMGMAGMMGMGGMMGGGDASTFCALHNKQRGARNLQPHPSNPAVFICMETDPCKGGGGVQADSANICATHGKRRGAQNMQPHPSAPGLYVCHEHDKCK